MQYSPFGVMFNGYRPGPPGNSGQKRSNKRSPSANRFHVPYSNLNPNITGFPNQNAYKPNIDVKSQPPKSIELQTTPVGIEEIYTLGDLEKLNQKIEKNLS